jgi:hypothetical protein
MELQYCALTKGTVVSRWHGHLRIAVGRSISRNAAVSGRRAAPVAERGTLAPLSAAW